MKKVSGKYLPILIEAVIFAIWNILIWTIADLKKANLFFYCGYGFTCLAFLVVAIIFILKLNKNAIFSVMLPVYIVTAVYFLISFIMNMVFMILGDKTNVKAVVIPNAILVLLYIAAFGIMFYGIKHIAGNNKRIDKKVASLKMVAIEIGQIADLSSSDDVRTLLGQLREGVEYSDPLGAEETEPLEAEFKKKVAEIRMLVEGNYEQDLIANKIKEAQSKLRQRNEVLRTLK